MGTMTIPGQQMGVQPPQPELDQEAQAQGGAQPPTGTNAGEERTKDSPVHPPDWVDVPLDLQTKLLDLIDKYTIRWAPVRRRRIRQVLRSREYFKGNQYISFDTDNFTWFDPLEAMFDGDPDKEDLGVYRYVNNIHQMLALSFVAALSPQVPKTQYMPADAERLEDLATAKAASRLQQVIERKNNIKRIQKMELLLLWTDGCYFSYQRFLVDSDRGKTHREPEWGMVPGELPDRFECPNCGATTPAANMPSFAQMSCMGDQKQPGCGQPLSPSNYYPAEPIEYPGITGYKDVPNGMVAIDVYGILNVVAAPYANRLYQSPLLRLDEEVDLGSVRSAYPDKWDDLKSGEFSTGDTMLERMARQRVLNMIGGRNNMTTDEMPTFSRSWIQPWAFASLTGKSLAQQLKQMFPDGVMVVHVGRTFLEARKANSRDSWTWCGMVEGYGLNPPGVGDVVLDVQDRFNDSGNSMAEHMDRNATGLVLVDGSAIDSRKLNNKPMLAGTLTEIPRKGPNMNKPMRDIVTQITLGQTPGLAEYMDKLLLFAQLVSGVLPQIFGGSDPNVKTAQGQRQMYNIALGRLGLFWDNVREEHAEKAGLCVRIAAKNYTADILDVVATGDQEFRNEYVRINDLSGEFHAYAETDQGFPQTYAEIQQRLQDLFTAAQGEAAQTLIMEIMEDPANQKTIANYLLPANIVLPGDDARIKYTRIINILLGQKAKLINGVMVPSILVDQTYDRKYVELIKQVVNDWAIKNWKLQADNPDGWNNVLAYYTMAAELGAQMEMEQQVRAAAAQTAGAIGAAKHEASKGGGKPPADNQPAPGPTVGVGAP